MSALILHVRLHDGRYHGQGDWPPAPARLFQALVAGAGLAGPLGHEEQAALGWLERQDAPIIAAPSARRVPRGVRLFVPNNDADLIEGDPRRTAEIRTAQKAFRPYLFDETVPFVYAWTGVTEEEERFARVICTLAERLYQLGRGLDMAWGWGELLEEDRLEQLLAAYPGRVHRPSPGTSETMLLSPCPGSLASLENRRGAYRERFRPEKKRRAVTVVLRQLPMPRFRQVAYESPPSRVLYELRATSREDSFAPWPFTRVSTLVVRLRDGAVERLKRALSARSADIDRVLVGRKPDATNDGPTQDRVRILPLPSIGHVHADLEVRRVLVEVPPTCPLRPDDVHWAFSGLGVADAETGQIHTVLVRSDDEKFLRHYGLKDDKCHRVWRTVTPAALPEHARRRPMDPARRRDEPQKGRERAGKHARLAAAVCEALRHARVDASVEVLRVQREPFDGNGAPAEAFAAGTRFAKERLWHVEVAFEAPTSGPLAVGDGRFLGLGVMAPLVTTTTTGIHVLTIESGLNGDPEPEHLARTLRRAVMARARASLGDEPLPAFFSGHEPGGGPARAEQSSHLAFTCDRIRSRLVVVAPHVLDRRDPTPEEKRHLAILDEVLQDLRELRAGSAGRLTLRRSDLDADRDPLTAPSRAWESVTTFVVTRHAQLGDARAALAANLVAECRRHALPEPVVQPLYVEGLPAVGLGGRARLVFPVATRGPLLLGKTRYTGGGLFARADRDSS